MFRLVPFADWEETCGMGEVEAVPAELVRRFGPPSPRDGYKISGEYIFIDAAGEPFIVYDWKSTSLYAPTLPTPEEFWAGEETEQFSVATREVEIDDFAEWFRAQLL